jgi:hypothetical protein
MVADSIIAVTLNENYTCVSSPGPDQCSGFSAASGLKSGQSNRKRNSEKVNIKSSSGGL